jgi:transcriptional regulator GlxA family with amidase domain
MATLFNYLCRKNISMKHLTILVPDGQPNPITVISTYMAFLQAEKYLAIKGGKSVFEKIVVAGISKKVKVYDGLFSVAPIENIAKIKKTNLIIIPAFLPQTNPEQNIKLNKKTIDWIKWQYKNGAEIASLCTGAYLLGATKLIDGRKCSIHWNDANKFQNMFPQVDLVADQVITYENGIYTCGGAFSFMNLIIYLIENYYGRAMAIHSQIDIDRNSQSPYIIFNGQKSHTDEIVLKAQEFIEKNSMDKLSVEKLAKKLAVSRRSFDRRFVKATGNTPIEYMQRVKMETAKKLLEAFPVKIFRKLCTKQDITDVKAFRDVFRK